tara:strand:- start:1479 stop:2126 length:648 start_codon:yes stop_codon:yes gene_type:complete
MTVAAKICGLNDAAVVAAAIDAGADYLGFVFYPPSPRAVSPERAGALLAPVKGRVKAVGLFVDPTDDDIAAVLAVVELDLLQLHGRETPERVAAIRQRFGLPVLKAIKIAGRADLERAGAYEGVADMLLFDAKPPTDMTDALPGGNGLSFDWHLLAERPPHGPWMLSGGLDADNVAEAIRIAHPPAVDVSSGVEFEPGRKNPVAIKAFLDAAKAL